MSIYPFSTGSQFGDWRGSNCCRCTKEADCEIDRALWDACCGDGTVSNEIAQRMGYAEPKQGEYPQYVWQCTEVEWTEEWKEKCRKSVISQ